MSVPPFAFCQICTVFVTLFVKNAEYVEKPKYILTFFRKCDIILVHNNSITDFRTKVNRISHNFFEICDILMFFVENLITELRNEERK